MEYSRKGRAMTASSLIARERPGIVRFMFSTVSNHKVVLAAGLGEGRISGFFCRRKSPAREPQFAIQLEVVVTDAGSLTAYTAFYSGSRLQAMQQDGPDRVVADSLVHLRLWLQSKRHPCRTRLPSNKLSHKD
jgi:hypothetical protein